MRFEYDQQRVDKYRRTLAYQAATGRVLENVAQQSCAMKFERLKQPTSIVNREIPDARIIRSRSSSPA